MPNGPGGQDKLEADMRSSVMTRAAQIVFALAVLGAALPCGATYTIELPEVLGVHEGAELIFPLTIPALGSVTSTYLEMSGSQIAGIRANCTPPPDEYPDGAGFQLIVQLPGLPEFLFDIACGHLSADASDWTVTVPFVPNAPGSIFSIPGTMEARFAIGDVPPSVLCAAFLSMPVVTINTARIVTDGVVGAESATWGQVRRLYR
ncbi:MAG: hypothetical protein ACYDIE_01370 [Candidatus Krumholzibacteriia bacterium]